MHVEEQEEHLMLQPDSTVQLSIAQLKMRRTNLHVYTLRLSLSGVCHRNCPAAHLLYPSVFAVED